MHRAVLLPLPALLLAGCATVPGGDRLAQQDPLEKINRPIWAVDQAFDKVIAKPATNVYRAVFPKPIRSGVTHFFSNLSEPWSAINNLLQGKPKRAGRSLARFVVNTTIGVAGLGDPATKLKIKAAPEDFGQTLAVWGINAGPYLVLPLLGPSTLRDAVGTAVAWGADPYRICLNYCGLPHGVPTGLTIAYTLDVRSQLIDSGADAFLASSADSYATARSAYLQRREAEIVDQDGSEGTNPASATAGDADLNAALNQIDGSSGGTTSPTVPATPGAGTPASPAAPDTAPSSAPPSDVPAPSNAPGGGDAALSQALDQQDQGNSAAAGTNGTAAPAAQPRPAQPAH